MRLGCLNERVKILAVAGLVHVFHRDEFERGGIDAVTRTVRARAVVEHMAEGTGIERIRPLAVLPWP
jgi:hypothetical protein